MFVAVGLATFNFLLVTSHVLSFLALAQLLIRLVPFVVFLSLTMERTQVLLQFSLFKPMESLSILRDSLLSTHY